MTLLSTKCENNEGSKVAHIEILSKSRINEHGDR